VGTSTQQQIDAATAEPKRQQAARWKAAPGQIAAAVTAALAEAQRKAAAAVQWKIEGPIAVLPDGVIAWGSQGSSPDRPRFHDHSFGESSGTSRAR